MIKGDKHTKPSKIGYLQKALKIFKEGFCEDIINEAFGLKNNALIEKHHLSLIILMSFYLDFKVKFI